jgi:hypothetical protein
MFRRSAILYRGCEATDRYGVGAPKGTPVDVIAKLNQQINFGARGFRDRRAACRPVLQSAAHPEVLRKDNGNRRAIVGVESVDCGTIAWRTRQEDAQACHMGIFDPLDLNAMEEREQSILTPRRDRLKAWIAGLAQKLFSHGRSRSLDQLVRVCIIVGMLMWLYACWG